MTPTTLLSGSHPRRQGSIPSSLCRDIFDKRGIEYDRTSNNLRFEVQKGRHTKLPVPLKGVLCQSQKSKEERRKALPLPFLVGLLASDCQPSRDIFLVKEISPSQTRSLGPPQHPVFHKRGHRNVHKSPEPGSCRGFKEATASGSGNAGRRTNCSRLAAVNPTACFCALPAALIMPRIVARIPRPR